MTNASVIKSALSITNNLEELEELYPFVFKRLKNMFAIRLLSQLLLSEMINNAPFDFTYWLTEYPLESYPTPKTLPGLFILEGASISKNSRFCAGPQVGYKEFEITRTLAGGVVVSFSGYHKLISQVRYGSKSASESYPISLVEGIYVSRLNKDNSLSLDSGNKYRLIEDEHLLEGEYKVDGNELILVLQDGTTVNGIIQDGVLIDPNFELWTIDSDNK